MARCRGVAGHSSMAPRYVNALHLAADFLAALRQEQQAFATGGVLDEAYDVPCSTVHAGRMQGGVALNIVPDHASLEFELRHLPQDDPDAFLARLRQSADGIIAPFTASHPEAGIEIEVSNSYPGLAMAADHPGSRARGGAERLAADHQGRLWHRGRLFRAAWHSDGGLRTGRYGRAGAQARRISVDGATGRM